MVVGQGGGLPPAVIGEGEAVRLRKWSCPSMVSSRTLMASVFKFCLKAGRFRTGRPRGYPPAIRSIGHGFPLRASHGVVDDLGGAVRGDGGRGAVGQRVQALIGFDRFALRFDYAGGGGRGRPVALRLIRGENLLVRGHRVGRTEGDPPQQHRLPLGGQRQGMLAGGQIIFQRAGRRVGRGAGGGGQPLGLFLLPGGGFGCRCRRSSPGPRSPSGARTPLPPIRQRGGCRPAGCPAGWCFPGLRRDSRGIPACSILPAPR